MEEKIIEAKFKKNAFAYTVLGISLGLFVIAFSYATSYCNTRLYYYHKPNFLFVIIDPIEYGVFSPAWFTWLGVIGLIYFGIVCLQMNRCALTITNQRVTGKASFGKIVDLPLNQISAIGLGMFSRFTVATSSGRIHFWWVENRDEVHKALSELLSKFQQEKNTVQTNVINTSNADELAKYKQLLDNGTITQGEFDAKKKQLLGL